MDQDNQRTDADINDRLTDWTDSQSPVFRIMDDASSIATILHHVFEHVQEAVIVYSLDDEDRPLAITHANFSAQALVGYSLEELQKAGITHIHHHARIDALLTTHRQLRTVGQVHSDSFYVAKDGRMIPVEVTVYALEVSGVRYVVSLSRDISERNEAQRREVDRANFDDETGFPNEFWLRNKLAAILGRMELSIIAVGLDEFVEMRDSYGQAVMNEVLREVMIRIQRLFPNAYVGKIGRNEFVVIAYGETVRQISMQMIDREIQRPIQIGRFMFRLTGSFGMSVMDDSQLETNENDMSLLSQAVLALHTAERQSIPYQFYSHQLKKQFHEKHHTYIALMEALDQDHLSVVYQPKWSNDGHLFGAEALCRWHTDETDVSPNVFIPIAEEFGLIHQLGLRMLDLVCRDISTNPALRESNMTISVNCSVKQLDRELFVKEIQAILACYDVDPLRVGFEVTESVFADSGRRISLLGEVQRMGHKLAIDDFGTGYSSLQYFRNLVPDVLKIDQSFVRSLETDYRSKIIVEGMIAMAHNLGAIVVAEGVETQNQLHWLKDKGCDLYQGFLLGKPMSINSFLDLIKETIS